MQHIADDFNQRFVITSLVNERVVHDNEARKAEHAPGKIYPSSVHKCSRELCFELLGYEKPQMEPRILKIMDNGNFVHERYQKLWKDMGILVADEIPIKEENLRISGRMDALLNVENQIAIGEIKSSGNSPFTRMKDANKPDPKFVAQLQLYMHLANVDLGVIYIENKNDQDVLEFWITYDEEYCKSLFEKLNTVRKYADDKKIISRDLAASLDSFGADEKKLYKGKYTQYAFYCRYCDYRDECYKE